MEWREARKGTFSAKKQPHNDMAEKVASALARLVEISEKTNEISKNGT